jgi:hypothetical protein
MKQHLHWVKVMDIPFRIDDIIYVRKRKYELLPNGHVKNEKGVEGRLHNSQFVPECCFGCKHLDYEPVDDYYPAYYFCGWNQRMPTAKGSCKRFESK